MLAVLIYFLVALVVHSLAILWTLDTQTPAAIAGAILASVAACLASKDFALLSSSRVPWSHAHLCFVAHLAYTGSKIVEARQTIGIAILAVCTHYRCALALTAA